VTLMICFKPNEVLPSAPVTVNDYRKLIIDQDNIRNAWISSYTGNTEVAFFFDQDADNLSYTKGRACSSCACLYYVIRV